MSRDTLVMFSSHYPSELTIPVELSVVAPHFERVLYLPSVIRKGGGGRPSGLPPNVEVVDVLARQVPDSSMANAARALSLVAIAGRRPGNWGPYRAHFRTYASIARQQVMLSRVLASFVAERDLRDAVFYDYWFENTTLALALLRQRGLIRRAMARAHGFDVYDERAPNWRVPFREWKAEHLDLIVAISEHGRAYMKGRLPSRLHDKIVVSHLGVAPQEPSLQCGGVPTILSASHLRAFKQVHRIPDVLARVETPLRWVHFGDGPMMAETRRKAEALPPHIQWELRGDRSRSEVLRFFSSEDVTLFLSLSSAEGLPVSMMEAISFGVPVMAHDAFGIPELVNERTGVLLDPDAAFKDIAAAVDGALESGRFDSAAIAAFQRERFNMHRNYESFAGMLHSL